MSTGNTHLHSSLSSYIFILLFLPLLLCPPHSPQSSFSVYVFVYCRDESLRVSEEEVEAAKVRKANAIARKSKMEDKLRVNNEIKTLKQTLLTRLYMQRVNINPVESKKIVALPGETPEPTLCHPDSSSSYTFIHIVSHRFCVLIDCLSYTVILLTLLLQCT